MAKSIYRLYKDVLLLELYAIMTYCSFSKILKKHDKTTGYSTRIAFMSNMVNKANFTSYPDLLAMISRCETLFEEVSQKLLIEGNSALCDDERLFLSMIHRFYGQMTEKAKEEGDPNTHSREEVLNKRQAMTVNFSVQSKTPGFQDSSKNASSLRSLVEENEKRKNCLSDDQDEQSESQHQEWFPVNDQRPQSFQQGRPQLAVAKPDQRNRKVAQGAADGNPYAERQ